MEKIYLISQLLVFIAYLICGIAFLQKSQLKIIMLSTAFNSLMLIQYVLLGGTMGIISNIVMIIRNIIFYINLKNNRRNHFSTFIIFSLLIILLTSFFYKSIIDIFPCIIAICGTYVYWVNNTRILRIGNILCSICYIIYAIPLKSYVTIIAESYLITTTLIGYIKHENMKLLKS